MAKVQAVRFLHDYFATVLGCSSAQRLVTWVGWVAQRAASLVFPYGLTNQDHRGDRGKRWVNALCCRSLAVKLSDRVLNLLSWPYHIVVVGPMMQPSSYCCSRFLNIFEYFRASGSFLGTSYRLVQIWQRFVRFWVDFGPALGTHVGASLEANTVGNRKNVVFCHFFESL